MKKLASTLISTGIFTTIAVFAEVLYEPKFRDPFVLKLRMDNDKFHEQSFGKIPYVYKNNVFLFAGEQFGINIKKASKGKFNISYTKDRKNADIHFVFDQKQIQKPDWGMVLITTNNTKKTIKYKVFMTRPNKKGIYSSVPALVKPGVANYEHWPYPILQLVVTEISVQ